MVKYIQPFRLFLIASLAFYLALFALVPPGEYIYIDNDTRDEITQSIREGQEVAVAEIPEDARERLERANIEINASDEWFRQDIENQVIAVLDNPDQFAAQLEDWLPRLSILLVPATILALSILHIWRRRLYVYDHAIHALHLHSWVYLTGAFFMSAGSWLPDIFLYGYLFWFLFYVWRSLAVAGSAGVIMSGIRFFLMLITWTVFITLIMVATIIISGLSVQG